LDFKKIKNENENWNWRSSFNKSSKLDSYPQI
jgi:hypothetical protein